MNTADRMKNVQPSPTVALGNKVAEMKAAGEDIISFTVGEPDFDTPVNIREAAKKALDEGWTHYAPSSGLPKFKEVIAASERENNIPCDASNIIVAPTKHTLYMSCTALLNPGDEVIIQDPAWVSYEPCTVINGAKPVFVDSSKTDLHFTPDSIAEAITPKTKMIIVNTPSNPTGVVMTEAELKGIADLAIDHDLIVLADEIYQKILYEGKHHSIASFDGMFDRTVTINGLSKAYAMTGWRSGWLIAPPGLFPDISKVQQHSITCIPPFIQIAGIEALTNTKEEVIKMREEFRKRRDLMHSLLNELPGWTCSKPEGAFYLFPKFESGMNSMQVAEKLLTEAKVAVTPGSAFGSSVDDHLRFSYAASEDVIREGIRRVGTVGL